MPTLDEMRGKSPEDIKNEREQQKQQELNQAGGGEQEPQQTQPQNQQTQEDTQTKQQKAKQVFSDGDEPNTSSNVAEVENRQQTEDANEERQRNINTLQNQFGTNLEEIPENFREEALKMAKSYRHAQGKYTEATQQRSELEDKLSEAKQAQQVVDNLNGFLQQNPDIDRMIQQRLNGNNENPQQTGQEPQGQPNSVPQQQGQLTEQQLINAGYIKAGELDGLDDLGRRERLMEARIEHKADQKLNQYQQGLQQADQKFQQKKQQEKIQTLNKQRKDDGIDRFVADYGVDLSQLDDATIQAVSRRANLIKDPAGDGSLIDKDAYYDALRKELALRGNLPEQSQQPQQANMNQLQNTGVSVNKRTQQRQPQSVTDIMEQKEKERRAGLANTHPRVANN